MLAVATLYLVAQGSQVVSEGRRREVDPHSSRVGGRPSARWGSSYFKLGWRYLRRFLSGLPYYPLLSSIRLTKESDPEPVMASKTQHAKRDQERFDLLDFCSPEKIPAFPMTLPLAA